MKTTVCRFCENCQFFEPDLEEPNDGFCFHPNSETFKSYIPGRACDLFQDNNKIRAVEVLQL